MALVVVSVLVFLLKKELMDGVLPCSDISSNLLPEIFRVTIPGYLTNKSNLNQLGKLSF